MEKAIYAVECSTKDQWNAVLGEIGISSKMRSWEFDNSIKPEKARNTITFHPQAHLHRNTLGHFLSAGFTIITPEEFIKYPYHYLKQKPADKPEEEKNVFQAGHDYIVRVNKICEKIKIIEVTKTCYCYKVDTDLCHRWEMIKDFESNHKLVEDLTPAKKETGKVPEEQEIIESTVIGVSILAGIILVGDYLFDNSESKKGK